MADTSFSRQFHGPYLSAPNSCAAAAASIATLGIRPRLGLMEPYCVLGLSSAKGPIVFISNRSLNVSQCPSVSLSVRQCSPV